ncbi:TMEM43 family protein [Luteimonas sp. 8-5]|uniref:TMEM43 family protein n=1 Tax=Luteimonas sp. 8-5 TaxID=3039387 RepID=UPI0024364340|nr:TMEM43 family protein [Luteimonas sp. 8-5]MDG6347461.1 TMEM43 family protein [Luteimonas sp. 8-5]
MKAIAGLLAAGCLLVATAVAAQEQAPAPSAPPQAEGKLRDPDFGVRTSHFGLERQVEMFQWREDGGAYARGWSDAPVDSAAFLPGHDNPPFPIRSQRWEASAVTVDGVPLDPEVVKGLGQWREFRPAFSALPGNLAATFQPQGDGLGSAMNPLAPEVGDLRIHWRELVLPPLAERIELRDGRWRLRAGEADGVGEAKAARGGDSRPGRAHWWWWLAVVPVVLLLVALRRRRH